MQSLSLVMSECFLSGHGQGHVSNFYIVDLENFATASRRYTGDMLVPRTHNKLGYRSFSAAGPRLWNDLPPGLRRPRLTFDSFRHL